MANKFLFLIKVYCFTFFALLASCEKKSACLSLTEFYVNPSLISEYSNYCKLVDNALKEDSDLLIFFKLEVTEEHMFYHGEVLLQIAEKVGANRTVSTIEKLDKGDRFRLMIYMRSGTIDSSLPKNKKLHLKEMYIKLEETVGL